MNKNTFSDRSASIWYIFILNAAVYLFYFFSLNPGYLSYDAGEHILAFSKTRDLLFTLLPETHSESFFYKFYVFLFFSISKNLAVLGVFQIVLASAINTYCWFLLRKFSTATIAFLVLLAMIFSPLNGILAVWYHRSSLFAWLVFLNLLLLYRFSKVHKFKTSERVIFLINLVLISFLRLDGIIISLASFFIYISKADFRRRAKILISLIFIAVLTSYNLIPKTLDDDYHKIFLFMHPVKRIHHSADLNFSKNDEQVLRSIFPDRSDRKIWLGAEKEGGKDWLIPEIHSSPASERETDSFVKWGILLILKNFPHFIKTQAEVFLASSLLIAPEAGYYYHTDIHEGTDYYTELQEKIGIPKMSYSSLGAKIEKWYLEDSSGPSSGREFSLRALPIATFVPFIFLFIWFALGLKLNRSVLIPLIPLLIYAVFMFLFQPKPKAYYWTWLVYSYSFIVFALGYEVLSTKKRK